jgi:hypothetical protein
MHLEHAWTDLAWTGKRRSGESYGVGDCYIVNVPRRLRAIDSPRQLNGKRC